MFINKGLIRFVFLVLLLALTACGATMGKKLDTPAGTFKIEEVQLSDRFPPDCSSGAGCWSADSGYQMLVIWLTPPSDFDGDISEGMTDEQPYLTIDGDNRIEIAISGIAQTRYFLAFTPPDSASEFTLTWPDNSPLDLGNFLEN